MVSGVTGVSWVDSIHNSIDTSGWSPDRKFIARLSLALYLATCEQTQDRVVLHQFRRVLIRAGLIPEGCESELVIIALGSK